MYGRHALSLVHVVRLVDSRQHSNMLPRTRTDLETPPKNHLPVANKKPARIRHQP